MKEQTLLNIVKIIKIKGLIKSRKNHPRIISIDLSGQGIHHAYYAHLFFIFQEV